MSKKELEITCPCCGSRLAVDLRTEKVVRSRRPEELDDAGRPKVGEADWTDALSKVRGRDETRENRLDDALQREKGRESTLDDLFRQAQDKLSGEDDDED